MKKKASQTTARKPSKRTEGSAAAVDDGVPNPLILLDLAVGELVKINQSLDDLNRAVSELVANSKDLEDIEHHLEELRGDVTDIKGHLKRTAG